ncbi:hypothetical protein ACJ73_09768 [Blastomyces percursus]|uniref:Uncharacterized protein n=1 Tax=Blastomyces percursus TaxID=1658174 RepID=A0A1J9P3R7_9EURO|nr:hypothetical protein ACJ73_09768 [Blastomyces percursus]
MQSGELENPDQHRAATLSIEDPLRSSYPEWDLMDDRRKQKFRNRFHEQKRQGARSWRMASVVGLGTLLAGGDTLAKVIKNHSTYPLSKLDAVISYVANAHPDVISLYYEFDDLVKQILLGETLTARPAEQVIDDGISRAAAANPTTQKAKENWQQIDPASVSQKFLEEFLHHYA